MGSIWQQYRMNSKRQIKSYIFRIQDQYNLTPATEAETKLKIERENMFMVDSVLNSKIPDLLEVMEKARARYRSRMDALALRMEGEILGLAEQLKVLCLKLLGNKV